MLHGRQHKLESPRQAHQKRMPWPPQLTTMAAAMRGGAADVVQGRVFAAGLCGENTSMSARELAAASSIEGFHVVRGLHVATEAAAATRVQGNKMSTDVPRATAVLG